MKRNYKLYCKYYENIENYEKALADNFKGWHCHHRLETHNSDGERRLVDISYNELKALGMYYNRPPEELIFLRKGEHSKLHNKGRTLSDEHKKKISEANKGENNGMFGKHHSKEAIKKNSEAHKGEKHPMYGKHLSEETKNKLSEELKGRKFSEDTKKKMSCSWDYKKHFTEETKERMSAAQKGKHWYTNGKETKFCFECPPGFAPGRLRK